MQTALWLAGNHFPITTLPQWALLVDCFIEVWQMNYPKLFPHQGTPSLPWASRDRPHSSTLISTHPFLPLINRDKVWLLIQKPTSQHGSVPWLFDPEMRRKLFRFRMVNISIRSTWRAPQNQRNRSICPCIFPIKKSWFVCGTDLREKGRKKSEWFRVSGQFSIHLVSHLTCVWFPPNVCVGFRA